jgi:hypothetical protein
MTIRRVTISVPEQVAGRIKKVAGSQSVSAWVTGLIEKHLADAELERQWQKFYRDVGPRREDIRRADTKLKRLLPSRSTPNALVSLECVYVLGCVWS